mmetsp:Transcript_112449/g.268040  ORF Transcript_112449/g.268040 Transcript_112449/m.268040 type:complete len:200 (+) Transcript_112449:145-744(+)
MQLPSDVEQAHRPSTQEDVHSICCLGKQHAHLLRQDLAQAGDIKGQVGSDVLDEEASTLCQHILLPALRNKTQSLEIQLTHRGRSLLHSKAENLRNLSSLILLWWHSQGLGLHPLHGLLQASAVPQLHQCLLGALAELLLVVGRECRDRSRRGGHFANQALLHFAAGGAVSHLGQRHCPLDLLRPLVHPASAPKVQEIL